MILNGWSKKMFLVDGFPRNNENNSSWEKVMAAATKMPFVMFIECTEETMIKRIHKRAAETQGVALRNDDNMEILKKRF